MLERKEAQVEIRLVEVEEKELPERQVLKEVQVAAEVLDLTHGQLGQQLHQLVCLVIMPEAEVAEGIP